MKRSTTYVFALAVGVSAAAIARAQVGPSGQPYLAGPYSMQFGTASSNVGWLFGAPSNSGSGGIPLTNTGPYQWQGGVWAQNILNGNPVVGGYTYVTVTLTDVTGNAGVSGGWFEVRYDGGTGSAFDAYIPKTGAAKGDGTNQLTATQIGVWAYTQATIPDYNYNTSTEGTNIRALYTSASTPAGNHWFTGDTFTSGTGAWFAIEGTLQQIIGTSTQPATQSQPTDHKLLDAINHPTIPKWDVFTAWENQVMTAAAGIYGPGTQAGMNHVFNWAFDPTNPANNAFMTNSAPIGANMVTTDPATGSTIGDFMGTIIGAITGTWWNVRGYCDYLGIRAALSVVVPILVFAWSVWKLIKAMIRVIAGQVGEAVVGS